MEDDNVTEAMVDAALAALAPYFDEDGRLGLLGLRDAVRKCVQAALDIQPKGI